MSRPNVLVLQADQFRADCLGAAGNPDVRTPALDRLAADGALFDAAFCPVPVCTPSRYSLLSGRYGHQHGGWSNRSTLAATIDTFPRVLRRAGYRTSAVGKMHLTPTYLDVGYDRMTLAEQDGPGRYDDDYHRDLYAAGLAPVTDLIDQEGEFRPLAPDHYWQTYGTSPSNLPEEWHSTTWIGQRALEELEHWDDDGGHLLHVSFIKPHHPFDPPASWWHAYDPDRLRLPPGWMAETPPDDERWLRQYFDYTGLTEERLRTVLAAYYATISHLDQQIGNLLRLLRRRGLYDDTLVIFTSDHGEYLGFHHLLLKDGPMYDPLVRVPLLLKLPSPPKLSGRPVPSDDSDLPDRSDDGMTGGSATTVQRRRDLASLVDVLPTVLSACGLPLDRVAGADSLPGRDLSVPDTEPGCVFAVDQRHGTVAMARSATHKLLLGADGEQDALYDLDADPLELHNLIGDPSAAEVQGRLRDALTRWMLFDAPVPTHLDHAEDIIDAPNVPRRVDAAAQQGRRRRFAAAVHHATSDDQTL